MYNFDLGHIVQCHLKNVEKGLNSMALPSHDYDEKTLQIYRVGLMTGEVMLLNMFQQVPIKWAL